MGDELRLHGPKYVWAMIALTVFLSFLMVSTIRFRSFKDLKLNARTFALVAFAVGSSALVSLQTKPAFVLVWLLVLLRRHRPGRDGASACRGARRGASEARRSLPPDRMTSRAELPRTQRPRLSSSRRMIEDLEVLREQARAAMARGDVAAAVTALAGGGHEDARGGPRLRRRAPSARGRAREDGRRAPGAGRGRGARLERPLGVEPRAAALAARAARSTARARSPRRGTRPRRRARWKTPGSWRPPRFLPREGRRLAGRARPLGAPGLARRLRGRPPPRSVAGESMYVAALVQFNLARCARQCQDAPQLREATVACGAPARGGGGPLRVDRAARARVRLLPGPRRRSGATAARSRTSSRASSTPSASCAKTT